MKREWRYRIFIWAFRLILLVVLAVFPGYWLVAAMHVYCSICPLHFRHFNDSQVIPVVYGYPTGETLRRVERGEIVLGGCVIRGPKPEAGVCPYCRRLTARYQPEIPAAISWDAATMKGMSAEECTSVRRYTADILPAPGCDSPDHVTVVLTTPDDIWLGTSESGLHRFDRKAGQWCSYDFRTMGFCISRISNRHGTISVQHDTIGQGQLFFEDCTTNRGKSWVRR